MLHKELEDFREASDPDSSEDRLSELSENLSEIVRGAVAANPSTPIAAAKLLEDDVSQHVLDSLRLREINIKIKLSPPGFISTKLH